MWWLKRERNKKATDKIKEDPISQRAKFQKFYQSKLWKQTRERHLAADPLNYLCAMCLSTGRTEVFAVVDHIEPISENWERRDDVTNCQSLCSYHHNHTKKIIENHQKQERISNRNMNALNSFE